jgi:hypothetical protein
MAGVGALWEVGKEEERKKSTRDALIGVENNGSDDSDPQVFCLQAKYNTRDMYSSVHCTLHDFLNIFFFFFFVGFFHPSNQGAEQTWIKKVLLNWSSELDTQKKR